MSPFNAISAIAASVAFAVGGYAVVRGDLDILIVGFTLALMFLVVAQKSLSSRISFSEGGRHEPILPSAIPALVTARSAAESLTDHAKTSVTFPMVTIDAANDDDGDDVLKALLTDSDTPMLVVIQERKGPVHTLLMPDVWTRLLSCDDLRRCA
jgi:hypothetical protein